MYRLRCKSLIAVTMSLMLICTGLFSVTAQAGVIPTQAAVEQQSLQYDRQQLLQALNQAEVRDQLLAMGVSPDAVEERVQSLTGAELAQLNAELEQLPAGQSVLGVLVLIFIVFIVTDMLCATDVYSFVRCINR